MLNSRVEFHSLAHMVGGVEELICDRYGACGGFGHILFGGDALFKAIDEVFDLRLDAAVGRDLDILDRAVFL